MTDETHYPDISSALLDLHRLLAIFLASEGIASVPRLETMRELRAQLEHDEITRILLSLAATVRIVDDRTWRGERSSLDLLFDTSCGQLTPDRNRPDVRKDLDIREACNKILHSYRIEPTKRMLASGDDVLDGHVVLHGTKPEGNRSFDWEASIEVAEFCEVAAQTLKFLADGNEPADPRS
jgi:hypothetical protein